MTHFAYTLDFWTHFCYRPFRNKSSSTFSYCPITVQDLARILRSILMKTSGNFVLGTTGFSTSLSKMTPTYSCTISAKRHRKRRHAKLKEPKRNAMTGFPERGNNYGKLVFQVSDLQKINDFHVLTVLSISYYRKQRFSPIT